MPDWKHSTPEFCRLALKIAQICQKQLMLTVFSHWSALNKLLLPSARCSASFFLEPVKQRGGKEKDPQVQFYSRIESTASASWQSNDVPRCSTEDIKPNSNVLEWVLIHIMSCLLNFRQSFQWLPVLLPPRFAFCVEDSQLTSIFPGKELWFVKCTDEWKRR